MEGQKEKEKDCCLWPMLTFSWLLMLHVGAAGKDPLFEDFCTESSIGITCYC